MLNNYYLLLLFSQFFDKIKHHFSELLNETKIDKSNLAVTLRRLMQIPLHRLKDYVRIINKIAMKYPPVSYMKLHVILTYSVDKLWT